MTRQARKQEEESRKRLQEHKFQVEDERGWSGQHGQHADTDEEQNYRPHRSGEQEALDND